MWFTDFSGGQPVVVALCDMNAGRLVGDLLYE